MAGNSRSGRKPKPTELKVLEGSFRKDRHRDEPVVPRGFPRAPKSLSDSERELWKTFPRPAWIATTDVIAVHAAVSLYARILDVQKAQLLAENPSRLINQEANLWGRLMAVVSSLGLTPTDRAKMRPPKEDAPDDKWAGIL